MAVVTQTLEVRDLGRIPYAEAMRLQDDLVEQRMSDGIGDTLLLLEHPPVITLGRRASMTDVYATEDALRARGIALERATRGGLVTYHGPGQVVGYPIVKLRSRGLSVPCYVRALELCVVDALHEIGIASHVEDGTVGVFTDVGKIAAIGVAVRHGVTLHGFAVNVQPDLAHYELINPCGIAERGVTSVEAILGHPVDIDEFKRRITRTLEQQLASVACTPAGR